MSHAWRLFFLGFIALAAVLGSLACPAGHDTVQFGLILPLTGPYDGEVALGAGPVHRVCLVGDDRHATPGALPGRSRYGSGWRPASDRLQGRAVCPRPG